MYRAWQKDAPKAVFLLVHGLGGHSGRWQDLADHLSGSGFSAYGIELRGFGETRGEKGHIDSFRTYYADLLRLRDIVLEENPGKKVFLLGESMGALVSFEVMRSYPGLFHGLVCMSPAFGSRLAFGAIDYIKMALSCIFMPGKKFSMPFSGEMCTRDPEYARKLDEDPLEHRLATARLLFGILGIQLRAALSSAKIEGSVLFLVPGEDRLVDPAASEGVFSRIVSGDKKITSYPGMYHCLSIDTGREKVFSDIARWAEERTLK